MTLHRGDAVQDVESGMTGRVVRVPSGLWEGQRLYPVTVWWYAARSGAQTTRIPSTQLRKVSGWHSRTDSAHPSLPSPR